LKFYAEAENWVIDTGETYDHGDAVMECGEKARSVLAEWNETSGEESNDE
jgi:hypothetical protein